MKVYAGPILDFIDTLIYYELVRVNVRSSKSDYAHWMYINDRA